MPVGGIACGQLYLGGDGRLWYWDIFTSATTTDYAGKIWAGPHYEHPLQPKPVVEQGFAIRVNQAEKTHVRRPRPPGIQGHHLPRRVPDRPGDLPRRRLAGGGLARGLLSVHPAERGGLVAAGDGALLPGEEHQPVAARGEPVRLARECGVSRGRRRPESPAAKRVRHECEGPRHALQHRRAGSRRISGPARPRVRGLRGRRLRRLDRRGQGVRRSALSRGRAAVLHGALGLRGQGVRQHAHDAARRGPGGRRSSIKGKLTSPEFTIERKFIQFRIGGGSDPNTLGLRLLIDGKVVRRAAGRGAGPMRAGCLRRARVPGQDGPAPDRRRGHGGLGAHDRRSDRLHGPPGPRFAAGCARVWLDGAEPPGGRSGGIDHDQRPDRSPSRRRGGAVAPLPGPELELGVGAEADGSAPDRRAGTQGGDQARENRPRSPSSSPGGSPTTARSAARWRPSRGCPG